MLKLLPRALLKKLFIIYALLTRAMTLGVKGVVRDKQGRVLLVRHTYIKGWHLPGGGVERGETLVEAVSKELREEASIVVTARPRYISIPIETREAAGLTMSPCLCVRSGRTGSNGNPAMKLQKLVFFHWTNCQKKPLHTHAIDCWKFSAIKQSTIIGDTDYWTV